MSDSFSNPSKEALEVLRLLKTFHNVLISGPPGTGKSLLMAEVRYWFEKMVSGPVVDPKKGANPLPAAGKTAIPDDVMPSPEKKKRSCWQITFHQGTKHKDFLRGLTPNPAGAFKVTSGPFYESLVHSGSADGAGLLEIDEINRGPAVAIFGDAITAIESDKRALPDGKPGPKTAQIHTISDDGTPQTVTLPHHLYILAVMNEADTSVEPLDVAFRRRFHPYRLNPSEATLQDHFGITNLAAELPATPVNAEQVYLAFLRAWKRVNELIEWTRGPEFQVGHGVFMFKPKPLPNDMPGATNYVHECWMRLHSYIGELFFGDTRSMAAILAANSTGNPFVLEEKFLAENQVQRLRVTAPITPATVYPFLIILGRER